jgi:hypothetical protein
VNGTTRTDGVTTHGISPTTARHASLSVTGPTQNVDGAARICEMEVNGG